MIISFICNELLKFKVNIVLHYQDNDDLYCFDAVL